MSPSLPLPGDDELPDDIRRALANLPPLNVFRAVAAVPASFRPFLELGGSLLAGAEIDATNREIAILAVATRDRRGLRAGPARTARPQRRRQRRRDRGDPRRRSSSGLDADGALVLRAATEISRDVRISDEALGLLVERWGEAGAAELILCVGYYNMVSRFLESTGVEIEPEQLLGEQTPDAIRRRAQ